MTSGAATESLVEAVGPGEQLDAPPTAALPELVAQGLGTNIWQALKETIDDPARTSAILLISDGQHNGGEDPIELAKKAAALDLPIYVVGAGDPNPPKNLSVNEVYVRERAYPDEPFEIEAVLAVQPSW